MSDFIARLNEELTGRYVVQRELGHGGMATVYLAEDLRHHRLVAMKVLSPEIAATIGRDRFLREIETAARLNHPHILPLHESGTAGEFVFYVMPYVEGESLRERLGREKQLSMADALSIAREIADALHYAHRHGVVHRDIKPENILLAEQHAVVADFGIARALVAAGGEKLTATGFAVGTPAYMSPEQAAGSRELDERSDQYSLACLLFELIAGVPPFVAPTSQGLIHQHLNTMPRPVTDLRPATPAAVRDALSRALAKVPADRYPTMAAFAAAIGAPAQDSMPAVAPPSALERAPTAEMPATRVAVAGDELGAGGLRPLRFPRRIRALALFGGLAALALAAVMAWQRWGKGAAAQPGLKDWILVAEFDGPADDPALARAARELVSASLDQSSIVATVPRGGLKAALRLAGMPDTTEVSGEVARELAVRGRIRTVVEGRIERVGKSYSLIARVLDAGDGHALLTVNEIARNEAAIIPSLGKLGRRMRAGLGEKRDAIRGSPEIWEVATPSFEAYRRFLRANELANSEGDDRTALVLASQALALDPDFASAWSLKGYAYDHLGVRDSAAAAFREALRRASRLSDYSRLNAEGVLSMNQGDLATAEATFAQAARRYPNSSAALGNRGAALGWAGRDEEALDCALRAAKIDPYGPPQWILVNEFNGLVQLGRLDEARGVAREMRGWNAKYAALGLEVAEGDWVGVDSVALSLASNVTATPEVRIPSLTAMAANRAAGGALGSAADALRRARSLAVEASRPDLAQAVERFQVLLAMVSGGTLGLERQNTDGDSTTTALITRGLWAALQGDSVGARRLLRGIESRPAEELSRHGSGPTMLRAWVTGLTGDWAGMVRLLGPPARQGSELGYVVDPIGRLPMRWLVARAYENLGRPDSAAAYLELALSTTRTSWDDRLPIRMASSLAHLKLVTLYARMGRVEDARRHWQVLSRTVRAPDPELQPRVANAHAALISAEGVTSSGGTK